MPPSTDPSPTRCPVLHPANLPRYSLLVSPSQHRSHRPVWFRGPMSCLCWEVQRCHTLSGVPRSRQTWGIGWTDSRTNRTASRLLKLLGIPTLSSCWHGHLRFHNSPLIGEFVKSWEGHTSTSIPHQHDPYGALVLLHHVAMHLGELVGFFSSLRIAIDK